jgi:hypothetical protein
MEVSPINSQLQLFSSDEDKIIWLAKAKSLLGLFSQCKEVKNQDTMTLLAASKLPSIFVITAGYLDPLVHP